jgi:toxin-antitoxin system PIN domain toxin
MTDRVPLLDVNVLLALYDPRHVHHEAAHRWLDEVDTFATTPVTETAFVRLVSNPEVSGESPATALAALRAVRELDGHRFVPDDASLTTPTIGLGTLVGHRQVTDFHLVNLAAGHGMALATFDAKLVRSLADDDRRHVLVVPV